MTKDLAPWFGHERTLEQQWKGLELIDWAGKSVLDLGCAEGEVTMRAMDLGAASAWGVEHREDYVRQARKRCPSVTWLCADLNEWPEAQPPRRWDVVLLLAILHKLRRPDVRLRAFARLAEETLILRLPPETGPVIVDIRSGNVQFDTRPIMVGLGFKQEAEHRDGPRGEYMSYWRRVVK
jgi:ubiquinone/menaquinone biosynthesis C-methylase UbiE